MTKELVPGQEQSVTMMPAHRTFWMEEHYFFVSRHIDVGFEAVCEPTFRRKYLPPFSGLKISRTRNQLAAGSSMFLRNVSSHTDYTALYFRRWQHSGLLMFLCFYCLQWRTWGWKCKGNCASSLPMPSHVTLTSLWSTWFATHFEHTGLPNLHPLFLDNCISTEILNWLEWR
jgi:hypothetical protein